ncbi:hypothetical protein, partial [Salmonella enterica]
DPHSEYAFNQLGVTYQSLRRYADADRAYATALGLSKNPVGEHMAQVFNVLMWKGDIAPMHTALAVLAPGSDAYVAN